MLSVWCEVILMEPELESGKGVRMEEGVEKPPQNCSQCDRG